MSLRIGALFAGYGGLDLAVTDVFGGSLAWYSEVDKGALKILGHRFPDVPNVGDVTAVDWSTVEPVDILTGGSPCQDLSHAGKRAGMTEGTRSNLWVAMREAIAQLRPRLIVWENVRGAASAEATSDLEHCPGCMGDPRHRGTVLRALGRVVGDLADLGYVGQVRGLRAAADVGAPHGRFRYFLAAHPEGDAGWLAHGDGGAATDADGGVNLASSARTDQRPVPCGNERGAAPTLLATPRCANGVMHDLRDPEAIGNPRGRLEDQVALLPTPSAQLAAGSQTHRSGARAGEFLLDGIAAQERWGDYAAAIARWEHILGRPAPAPTQTSSKGNPQLSAAFVEWMMGLPEGWVTDVPGITRNEALKALGNGVVPQQAAHALRTMLAWEAVA